MTDFKSLRDKATVDEVLEEVVAARKTGDDPRELLGGPRDWVDSIVPTAALMTTFTICNGLEVKNALRYSIIAAVIAEAVVVGIRLVRRETLRHAFSGAFGVVFAVVLVAKTGNVKNFVLPGIFVNAAYCIAFTASVLLRRPLVGVLARVFSDRPKEYHDHPTVRRAYAEATLICAFAFGLRVVVQETLRRSAPAFVVLSSKLILGYPLFIAVIAIVIAFLKWRTRDVPVPESPAEDEAEPRGEDAAADAP